MKNILIWRKMWRVSMKKTGMRKFQMKFQSLGKHKEEVTIESIPYIA
jgi:hypothetical protein